MPIERPLTPEELQWAKEQGLDPADLVVQEQEPTKQYSTTGAIAKSLQQKAGGVVGGGAAALAGPPIAGALMGGPVGLGAGIVIGVGSALAGSAAGQKIQEAIEGEEVAKRLEEEAAAAQEQHPVATTIGDITASMLASGGSFSPSTAIRGGKAAISKLAGKAITEEAKRDLANVAVGAGVMPAINTGINVVTTGELPSAGQLATDVVGGALFAKPSRLGELAGRLGHPEVKSPTTEEKAEPTAKVPAEEPKVEPVASDWMKTDEAGKHIIDDKFVRDEWNRLHPRPEVDGMDKTESYKALTAHKNTVKIPVNEMRVKLNEMELKNIAAKKAAENAEAAKPEVKLETDRTAPITKPEPTKAVTTENSSPKTVVEPAPVEDQARLQTELQADLERQARKSLGQLPTDEGITTAKPIVKDIGTAGELLKKFSNFPHRLAEVASEMNIDSESAGVKVVVSADKTDVLGKNSHYNIGDDVIYLRPEHEGHLPTILHEIAHASTIKKMPSELHTLHGEGLKSYIDRYLVDPNGNENVKEIMRCYLETAKKLNLESHLFGEKALAGNPEIAQAQLTHLRGQGYYVADIPEYIAGMFNDKGWRDTLSKIESGKKGESVFSRLYEAIKRLLTGSAKPNSMLERVLKPVEEIMAQERITEGSGERAAATTQTEKIIETLSKQKEPILNKEEYEALYKEGRLMQGKGYDWGKDKSIVYVPHLSMFARIKSPSEGFIRAAKKESPTQVEETKKPGVSFLPFLTARIDKVGVAHPTLAGKIATEAMHKAAGEREYLTGKYGNAFLPVIEKSGLTPEQVTKVLHYNHDISNFEKSPIKLTAQEAKLSEALKEHVRKVGEHINKEGPGVRLPSGSVRDIKLKEQGHVPPVLSQDVPYEWQQNPNGEKAIAYEKAYIDHLVKQGVSPDEALTILRDYKSALGNQQLEATTAFNAIRRAEGYGLPWEMLDQNMSSLLHRYAQRAARDVAFFKHMQSVPEVRKALDLVDETGKRMSQAQFPEIDNIRGSAEAQAAMRSILGIDIPRTPAFMAASRAGGNTVMGIGTAARNVLNLPAFALTYMQANQWKYMWKAIKNMSDSRVRALESNSVKPNFQEAFDAAGYRRDDPNPVINLLNKYSTFMRKWQGRDFSDKFEAEYLYSLGELLATDNIAKAQAGNVESRHFIKRFGDLIDGGPESLFKRKVTPDDISRLAKRFVDATRGTYNEEGLPSWAIEGELAPFAALSKFSIEKSNTVWKDVVEPAKSGNYGPLIRYSLASLGIGALIEQLNEMLTNKRGPDPTINEAMAGLTPEIGVAKAVGLLQLASFAGIVGDGAKAALQMYQGKELRYNQPLSLPLYTIITDTLMGNVKDAAAAIQEGQDPFEVLGLLATTIAGQSVQTMRYVDANIINPEEAKRKERFRDIRVFQTMEGERSGPVVKANPFMDADAKKFKRSGDIEEAMKMLPGLIQEAIKKSNGDPYDLQRRLKSLKSNSYQTMPSFENMPVSFLKYINRLKATQGEEEANERLMDYLRQNQVNQAKASAVP